MNYVKYSLIGAFVIMFGSAGCQYLVDRYNLPEDSVVEEIIEDVIEKEVGVQIDLTPDTPESHE